MMATGENPCICGNKDYTVFFCDRCKYPDQEMKDALPVRLPSRSCIINTEWIRNLFAHWKEKSASKNEVPR